MCGICGFVGFEDRSLLERMTNVLIHRGPDDSGFYYGQNVGLGHRRLSIIDLETGRQPIFNEDRSICIVYNGEIYNFKDIRTDLKASGHKFYTQTDTEVIVHSYEEKGIACIEDFNGEFAFAIWDNNQRRLFLARDRLGIRPLFYTLFGGNIVFASEIKSILQHPGIKKELNLEALDGYLTLRYIPGSLTMFKGIYKLPPASCLIFQRGEARIERYWEISLEEGENGRDRGEYIEGFYELLKDAVRIRLMSDVPLGAYLSGGIDSSAIVGLMSKSSISPVKTFAIGFGTEIDELNEARAVSRFFGTDHTEFVLQSQSFELLPEIVYYFDDPVGDAIIIPTYLLSKETRNGVKVVLTGEGADEILGGYIHQITMYWGKRYSQCLPHLLQELSLQIIQRLPHRFLDLFFPYPASLGEMGKGRILKYLGLIDSEEEAYLCLANLFDNDEKERLYKPEFYKELQGNDLKENLKKAFMNGRKTDILNKIIGFDLKNWLPDYTLYKQDTITMACSLEGRVPFLDHRLVEFTARLPSRLKIKGLTTKYLLRRAIERLLPSKIVKRKKQAFYLPTEKCFGKGFEEMAKDLLSDSKKRGYFNEDYLEDLLKDIRGSELLSNKRIMALLILEVWHQIVMDR